MTNRIIQSLLYIVLVVLCFALLALATAGFILILLALNYCVIVAAGYFFKSNFVIILFIVAFDTALVAVVNLFCQR